MARVFPLDKSWFSPELLNYIHFTTLLLSPILTILKNLQNLDQLPHVTHKIYAALSFQYSTSFEVARENKQKNRWMCVFIWKIKTTTLPY